MSKLYRGIDLEGKDPSDGTIKSKTHSKSWEDSSRRERKGIIDQVVLDATLHTADKEYAARFVLDSKARKATANAQIELTSKELNTIATLVEESKVHGLNIAQNSNSIQCISDDFADYKAEIEEKFAESAKKNYEDHKRTNERIRSVTKMVHRVAEDVFDARKLFN